MYEKVKLINTKELMRIMKIGKAKAYALMQSDSFPSMRIGATYFVTEDNLKKWLNEYVHRSIAL